MVGHFVSTKEKSLWIPHVKIVCCDVALKQKNILKKLKKWLICNPKKTDSVIHSWLFFHYWHSLKEKEEPISFFQQEERYFKGDGRDRTTKDIKKRSEWTEETILESHKHTKQEQWKSSEGYSKTHFAVALFDFILDLSKNYNHHLEYDQFCTQLRKIQIIC